MTQPVFGRIFCSIDQNCDQKVQFKTHRLRLLRFTQTEFWLDAGLTLDADMMLTLA